MRESSGRAVERSLTSLPLDNGETCIGIKPGFGGDTVPTRRLAGFRHDCSQCRRRAAGGERAALVAGQARTRLSMVPSGRRWNYEPVTSDAEGRRRQRSMRRSATGPDRGSGRLGPLPAGGRDRRPDGPATSYEFDAGWYVDQATTETPDGLEIALDKAEYRPGEIAKLKVSPRFAGEAARGRSATGVVLRKTVDIAASGRRRRHSRDRRLGCRRLCHRDPFPARRRTRDAHAASRHRREMAEGRSRRQQLAVALAPPSQTAAAPDADDPGHGVRRCAGRARPMSWWRRSMSASSTSPATRRRTRKAGFRPAPARPGNARPLRPADRRLARGDGSCSGPAATAAG